MSTQQPLHPLLSPVSEPNPRLQAFKAWREQKWSFRRTKSLEDICDVVCALIALYREEEALTLDQWLLDSVQFRGGYFLWSPVEYTTFLCATVCYREMSRRAPRRFSPPSGAQRLPCGAGTGRIGPRRLGRGSTPLPNASRLLRGVTCSGVCAAPRQQSPRGKEACSRPRLPNPGPSSQRRSTGCVFCWRRPESGRGVVWRSQEGRDHAPHTSSCRPRRSRTLGSRL